MNDGAPSYCWDTTVFLAWLNEEDGAPLTDIELVATEIDARRASLIVPVTIYTEILQSMLSAKQRKQLDAFLKRSNVVTANTTFAIADLAAKLRDAGLALTPQRKIKTPDATIVATAIIYRCNALHSLDKKGSGPLRMSDFPLVGKLKICKPMLLSRQLGLKGF